MNKKIKGTCILLLVNFICQTLAQSGVGSGDDANQCQQVPSVCKDPGSWCNQITDMTFECLCKPGFYNDSLSCEPALQFGGQLVYASSSFMRASAKQASISEVEDFLNPIYKNTNGYINVDNINVTAATFASYVLLYKPTSTESVETIQKAMQDGLDACSVGPDGCVVGSQPLNETATVEASGTYSVAVCDQYEGYCDTISTSCSTIEGSLNCKCNPGYVTMDGNSQYCKLDICNTDSDCNGPFGECVGQPGSCKCVFGFSGTHCRDPWLLVFITVGGSLLLILIAVLIALCVSKSKSSKKSKSAAYQNGNNSSTLHENPFYDKKGNIPESTENVLKTFNYKFNGNMRATVPSNLNFDDENYKRRSHAPSERAGSNASDNRSYVPDSHYERNGRGHNNYLD
uniref:mucin-13 isoform X2 n=1 Tax=Ciona intestinalis TaxID=7719 RepID=UPI000EF559B0|nr:mucin-13 isoform X2 [Ciona intestinalis]|eukprot:XP_026690453.1 mucin-13 isoform X2 [Ciona intestinalis]